MNRRWFILNLALLNISFMEINQKENTKGEWVFPWNMHPLVPYKIEVFGNLSICGKHQFPICHAFTEQFLYLLSSAISL